MRKIKFRIWDKHQFKFLYNWQEIIKGHIDSFNTDINPKNINALEDELLVFQQYTGLKDINGKEIYEGDILQIQNGNIGAVVYYGLEYYIKINESTHVTFHLKPNILGNIYENPEILKNI
jgi:uncharacterized phage protein (TIGR01671 family)